MGDERLPDGRIKPPFTSPDCPWRPMSGGCTVPENAVEFGQLNGETAYIGRVYDDDCWLIGTALPKKGYCYFLSKKAELKSTDNYEILTVDCGNPLEFQPADFESNLLFVAAGDQDHCLYAARLVEGQNTYVGWVDKANGMAHIPRDPALGPNQLKDDYDVLIHKYLDRLCICPMAPPHEY